MRPKYFLLIAVLVLSASIFSCSGTGDGDATGEGNDYPRAPFNPYPAHLSANQSRTPYFSWSCTDPDGDMLTYTLNLLKDDVEIFDSGAILDTFLYYSGTLDENTTYNWKVRAYDGELGNSILGFWEFTTGTGSNNPPFAPYNLEPHGPGQPLDVTLEWECFDPDGDLLTYDVWLNVVGEAPARVSAEQSETFYQTNGLTLDTAYDWRVWVFDAPGDSASSHLSGFSTVAGAMPDPPFNPYPADGATDVPVDVTLSWSGNHPGGLSMTYDISFSPAGGSLPDVSTGQSATAFTPPTLEYNSSYEWRVTAEDEQTNRTEGPLWSFTTEDEPPPPEGIYAELILGRRQNFSDFDSTLTRIDMVSARFDTAYAPDNPIHPLQATSVICCTTATGYDIPWNDSRKMHYLDNPSAGDFLAPGDEYTFVVEAGGGVPALTESIVFPLCTPYITGPANGDFVPRSGFELQWTHSCGGTVVITLFDLIFGDTDVYIVTDDDGSYTFTAGDLSVLDPMSYQLEVGLITENRRSITAPGYDPRSFIWARTIAAQLIYLNP